MTGWDADVAVVGLGAWGSSALWHLARRGIDVIGVERFTLGHGFGASHGGSRMFRLTCLEHPGLVPLAARSLELWRKLEGLGGRPLLRQSGGLLLGPEDGFIVGGTLRAAREHGIAVQRLSAPDVRGRFPRHASLPDSHVGVWESSAGLLRPEDCVRTAASLAEAAGATVFADTRVRAVELIQGGVVLRTAARDFRVRQAVVTVGSWLSALVPGMPLETLRMPVTWFRPAGPEPDFGLDRFPVFMRELADGRVLWGCGSEGGHDVKLGLEVGDGVTVPFDPDSDDRSVIREDWSQTADLLPVVLPGLDTVPAKAAACMFTRTPDGQFVVGRPGGDRRLVVAGGCNAHGFKHATGIGELLADLVQRRRPQIPADFLDPGRFPEDSFP